MKFRVVDYLSQTLRQDDTLPVDISYVELEGNYLKQYQEGKLCVQCYNSKLESESGITESDKVFYRSPEILGGLCTECLKDISNLLYRTEMFTCESCDRIYFAEYETDSCLCYNCYESSLDGCGYDDYPSDNDDYYDYGNPDYSCHEFC